MGTKLEISTRFAMVKVKNVKINLFIELTNANKKIAKIFLKREKWNVDSATNLFHEIDGKVTKKIKSKSKNKCNNCNKDEKDKKEEVVYRPLKPPQTWMNRKKPFKYQLF